MSAGNPVKNALKRGVKYGAATVGNFCPKRPGCSRILAYHSIGYRDHDERYAGGFPRSDGVARKAPGRVITLGDAAEGIGGRDV